MSENLISITESAQDYLRDLLARQNNDGIGVRIFVERPGTPHAECCMAYCPPGEQEDEDVRYDYDGFHAWVEGKSVKYLEDALIDYKKDSMGGQLTFKAPKSRVPDIGPDATVEERLNHVLYAGGCQGCSAVDRTLRDGVEKTLRERIPELAGVRDSTDHSVTENAYYQ